MSETIRFGDIVRTKGMRSLSMLVIKLHLQADDTELGKLDLLSMAPALSCKTRPFRGEKASWYQWRCKTPLCGKSYITENVL